MYTIEPHPPWNLSGINRYTGSVITGLSVVYQWPKASLTIVLTACLIEDELCGLLPLSLQQLVKATWRKSHRCSGEEGVYIVASLELGWKNKRKHPSSNVTTQYFWHAQLLIMEVLGFYRGHEAQDITRCFSSNFSSRGQD